MPFPYEPRPPGLGLWGLVYRWVSENAERPGWRTRLAVGLHRRLGRFTGYAQAWAATDPELAAYMEPELPRRPL